MKTQRQRPGLGRRLRYHLVELKDVLLGLAPRRRRARYGDLDFDWQHRVDTTESNVGLVTRLRGVLLGSQYQPADPGLFAQSMAALPIEFASYVFVDAGSGKGRALLMACQYPFRKVIGIERLPELHAIAERNLRARPAELRRCEQAESILGDVLEFVWPPQPTLLFLFNPFPEWVLVRLLARLRDSLQEHPRKLWVVYHNPVLEHVLADSGFLRRVNGSAYSAIYTNESGGIARD
jgi:SAM-dependent methyltransferase